SAKKDYRPWRVTDVEKLNQSYRNTESQTGLKTSQTQKPASSYENPKIGTPGYLTQSEVDYLRQQRKEAHAFAARVWGKKTK
ncbi:MAG: hypothetical protein ACOYI4_09105, partial [Christensenellales bacterium]